MNKECEMCKTIMVDVGNCRKYCKRCAAKRKYLNGLIQNRESNTYMKMITDEERKELRKEAFKIAEERIKKELEDNPL